MSVYAAGEKIDKNFNLINFGNQISINSNVQVVVLKNEEELRKFMKKLMKNVIIIGMVLVQFLIDEKFKNDICR